MTAFIIQTDVGYVSSPRGRIIAGGENAREEAHEFTDLELAEGIVWSLMLGGIYAELITLEDSHAK